MKVRIGTIIDVIIYVSFYIIIVLTTMALTFTYIERGKYRVALWKKDVQIQALILSCKMDFLIRQRRPDLARIDYESKRGVK